MVSHCGNSSKSNRKMTSLRYEDSKEANLHAYYSFKNIFRFERIFGPTWVSTGGERTTKEICLRMRLKPGMKVLDIGSGGGGSAFHMARQYGCNVLGVDLCENMISLAKERLKREEGVVQQRVTFVKGDVFKLSFLENEFDVIYSRDVIMHIENKEDLFKTVRPWLKPGGQFLITEYVRASQISKEFQEYLAERRYFLKTFLDYQKCLTNSGFRMIEAENMIEKFREISEEELSYFISCKEAFLKDFNQEDYDWMIGNWQAKVQTAKSGDQSWGLFLCTK